MLYLCWILRENVQHFLCSQLCIMRRRQRWLMAVNLLLTKDSWLKCKELYKSNHVPTDFLNACLALIDVQIPQFNTWHPSIMSKNKTQKSKQNTITGDTLPSPAFQRPVGNGSVLCKQTAQPQHRHLKLCVPGGRPDTDIVMPCILVWGGISNEALLMTHIGHWLSLAMGSIGAISMLKLGTLASTEPVSVSGQNWR